ncbi:MAG: zinc ribbon domain-containing protein [Candidatus Gracilibacteria bacterium]
MAMINCPECNEEVSDSASKCPKCGFQINKSKRSIFGKTIKWSFILFNILMLWWLIGGVGSVTEGMDAMSEAQKTGTAVGAGLGAMMIMTIWVMGDIILGLFVLFTRPKS